MKKIISVLLLIFAASMTYAQDIIVTTNEQKIEAKVIEISSTQIKYLVANMPDGPVFVLETNEVASILFANGQVKVFDNQYRKSVVMLPNNKEAYLYRVGNMYYYGGAVMRDNQYAQFLQRNLRQPSSIAGRWTLLLVLLNVVNCVKSVKNSRLGLAKIQPSVLPTKLELTLCLLVL